MEKYFTPISFEVSDPGYDPRHVFQHFYSEGERAFFFETDLERSAPPRFTSMGFGERLRLAIENEKLVLFRNQQKREFPGNPIEELKKVIQNLKVTAGFRSHVGALIGYIGYDVIRYIEDIAIPKNPEEEELSLVLFKTYLFFNHANRSIHISHIIESDHKPTVRETTEAIEVVKKCLDQILQLPLLPYPKYQAHLPPIDLPFTNNQKNRYLNSVRTIKDFIRKGDIFQAVPSEAFELKTQLRPLEIYNRLRDTSPAPYCFFLDLGDRCLMGSSPEMLVRVTDGRVETCPIAGTRPLGKTEEESQKLAQELLSSEKERAEHMMLVDLSRNDIGRVSQPGLVKVTQFLQRRDFSHVMHLLSVVQGQLKDSLNSWDALFSCFPAGTLSGAPKIRAMEIIQQLEPQNRGYYGGAIVASEFNGNMDSCIAIRSLRFKDGVVRMQAGAGVVADSDPEAEFQEVIDKTRSVRAALTESS